jgi:putative transposase
LTSTPDPGQLHIPGHPLHVIQRGRLRAACFSGTKDRLAYLDVLAQATWHVGCALHAYSLMGNHVHLLLTPSRRSSVTRLMDSLTERYAGYIRETYEHSDPLWDKSFETTPVHVRQYFLACMRYIELNPVRAGLVTRPQAYRWSSFRANALGAEDPLITPHAHYCALGRSPQMQQAAYRAMFIGK